MPNVDKGNFILASHSGTSKVSYFRKLDKAKIGDKVNIYYQNIKYVYKIKNKYLLNKDGNIEIYRNKDVTTLTLTTCDTKSDTKQLVVIAELESKNTF